ncbi:MAG TPA: hypothetical protein VJR24_11850 [Gemmatimonadaceae bacterium]|jgi:hypothetical protein|nr:hypothetical protein [Gemmatimonadaceae bacterium]
MVGRAWIIYAGPVAPDSAARRLEETGDGVWAIEFNMVLLATLDERDYIMRG